MQLTPRQQNTKRIYFGLAAASVAYITFLLCSSWVSAPVLGSGVSFSLFQAGSMASRINAHLPAGGLNDPMAFFESRAILYPLWGAATILLLFGYLYLMFKNHRRSLITGALGFGSGVVLAFSFINDVYRTNGVRAFRGRILDESFISVTGSTFLTMVLCVLCLSVSISVTAKYFTGRPIPETRKRMVAIRPGHRAGYFASLFHDMKRDKLLYLMLLLPLAYYLLFYYRPFTGLRMAFYDYSLIRGYGDFVGFGRFVQFFTDDLFWRIFRNTLVLNIYTLVWGFPMPILLAILFNELRSNRFRTITQTISYIPRFISVMIIAGLLTNFLNPSIGLVNIIRGWFGAEDIYFLMFPQYFRTIFVTQHIWTTAGFGSIIYYSSLRSIDMELYEAATIDGAGRFKQVLHITLPGLANTIAIMLILAVGGLLASNVDMVLLLYQPSTWEVSDLIGTYLLRMSGLGQGQAVQYVFRLPDYSLSTAVGLFNGVVACFLVVSANKVSKLLGGANIY
jgi:putative aldouronate transport system permease protein